MDDLGAGPTLNPDPLSPPPKKNKENARNQDFFSPQLALWNAGNMVSALIWGGWVGEFWGSGFFCSVAGEVSVLEV